MHGRSSWRWAASWRGSQLGCSMAVDIMSESMSESAWAHGSSSIGGVIGRDFGRYSKGTTNLYQQGNPRVNASAPSTTRETSVLLVPPEALACDVDPERVLYLG